MSAQRSCFAATTVSSILCAALHCLSDNDRPRLLCIDAVCINQHDLLERNRQVQIMCDIYKFADGLIIWLGKDADNVEMAFKGLVLLNAKIPLALSSDHERNGVLGKIEQGGSGHRTVGVELVHPRMSHPGGYYACRANVSCSTPSMDWDLFLNIAGKMYLERVYV